MATSVIHRRALATRYYEFAITHCAALTWLRHLGDAP